jgi:hypothetical protein
MEIVILEVKQAVGKWKVLAKEIGIARSEQTLMTSAFILSS